MFLAFGSEDPNNMPESPESRTVADKLRSYLVTRVITNCYIGERAKVKDLDKLQCPVTITGVRSYGKKVIIELSSSQLIIISLGMTGRVQFTPGNHSHIRFDVSDCEKKGMLRAMRPALNMYFDDYRYMGKIELISCEESATYFSKLGPDLLQHALDKSTWISSEEWLNIFYEKKSKRSLYDVLLDQSLVAGIGWYLMTEILYYSGVHPERRANTVTQDEWEKIRINSHKVVFLSYSYGGFTIKDYISPDGKPGLYPAAVYGKQQDPLGNPILHNKLKNGRTTHYVPTIQH